MTRAPASIVVTGGSGFIGTRLVGRLLAAGHEVRILDLRPSEAFPDCWTEGDVRDQASLDGVFRGADAVIHLAAEHRDDVRPISLYEDVNVGGMRAVCESATRAGIASLLFTSTVAVYGLGVTDCHEGSPVQPANEYGRTKAEAEAIVRAWAKAAPGRSAVIVRPTVVFGEDNRGNLYNLLRQIALGPFFMIGSGRNRKSIAYVDNVAAFLQHALKSPEGVSVFNYVDEPTIDMNELVSRCRRALGKSASVGLRIPYGLAYAGASLLDVIARVTGRRFAISRVRVKKFCAASVYSAEALQSTGFVVPVDMQDALRATILHEFGEDS